MDKPNFFVDLENRLHDMGHYPTILGGDFTIVLDKILNQSKPTFSRVPDSVLFAKLMCTSLGLTDVWRLNQPKDRDYTFYSEAHEVSSRLFSYF